MSFAKSFNLQEDMCEAVEGGTALAWRLLATLEGGSLLLATSALLAFTVRNKIVRQNRRRHIRNVLVTNTTNLLGRELKNRLEAHGCVVETVEINSDVTGPVSKGAYSCIRSDKVDAIVVVGAESKADDLDGVAGLVTEDVYDNLRLLESIASRLHPGGYIAWSCARDNTSSPGAFRNASTAFDTVLQASLIHIAKLRDCEPIWVGRRMTAKHAAEQTIGALFSCTHSPTFYGFSVRNACHRLGECLGRWLKILT